MSPSRRPSDHCPGSPAGKPSHRGTGRLRIIAGQWRSRQLPVANLEGLRPTPDRIRETLYNWLIGWVAGARCLDAFAGTGALGFEALSRGAEHATFLEYSPVAAKLLKENLVTLGCSAGEVINTDADQWLNQNNRPPYNLVFIDPPFHQGMVAPICEKLHRHGYLCDKALVYIESEIALGLPDVPSHWQLWKEKRAGQVASRLFKTYG